MARVKGRAFRSVLRAHASLCGSASLARALDLLPSNIAERFGHVGATAWYPLAHYVALWDAIESVVGEGSDYPRAVGRRYVEQDLNLVQMPALAALSTTKAFDTSSRLFGAYCDAGRRQSTRLGDQLVRVAFEGCIGFSAPMWAELRGAAEGFAEQSSHSSTNSSIVLGGCAGDSYFTIEVSWRTRRQLW
jgi:hypothetical protein